jgi:flagellin
MGVTRIQHNLSAMNAMSNYQGNSNALTGNLEKLSSGYRINSAADDAAGLAISEKMRSQIAGLQKAQDNANDGISLVQTAEGALTEVNSMLTRLKSLATQSANGTYEDGVDRANIQEETDALLSEIDRISESTNFNGIKLLDGSLDGESQVKNIGVTESTATSAIFQISGTVGALTSDFSTLEKEDIGSTVSYTVTWKDAEGNEKTTTANLTFQGAGDGTVNSTTKTKNFFTDDQGTRYDLNASGGLDNSNVFDAIKAGLEKDKEFAANFEIDKNSGQFQFKTKYTGSNAAEVIGTSGDSKFVSNTGKGLETNVKNDLSGAGTATLQQRAVDSYQKLDSKKITVVDQGASAAAIKAATFEIDGQKFLAVTSTFDDKDIKGLDSDINVIHMSSSTNAGTGITNATDVKTVAAEIQKATGRSTKTYSSSPDEMASAKIDATKTGIAADTDIVFTDINNKLKTDGNDLKLQVGDTPASYQKVTVKIQDMSSKGLGLTGLDLSNQEGAAKALDTIQNAVNAVSTQRGQLGALQNRLDHTLNSLDATEQNITAAESQIRDVDMAKEMTQYSKNNILVQAAQSMLAQANSLPQGVLSLLQ